MSEPVLVVTTGGTIDKVYFDAKSDYEVGDSVVEELLREAHVRYAWEMLPLMKKDSLDFTDVDRHAVRAAIEQRPHKRIVITHGTDTMTDTAEVLSGLDGRVVILTGALSPARFAHSDATFNVGMAFAAVQALKPGIYIVMNGQVFDAFNVRKDRDRNVFVEVT